jgi:hypothetical protein
MSQQLIPSEQITTESHFHDELPNTKPTK